MVKYLSTWAELVPVWIGVGWGNIFRSVQVPEESTFSEVF